MFERYTEKARRVIFFARYEATQFGTLAIEPEHVLLGLVREDKNLFSRLLGRTRSISIASLRADIEAYSPPGERISTAVELPLAPQTKWVLAYAHEESDNLKHKHIGTEHIVMGLLRLENSFAGSWLRKAGCELEQIREILRKPR